ncbi:hypothetical protein BT93_G0320 [Corymbia citriodora subsp. variegata]|nr:hypothetical protein BT93_G0320 [Corymbia citriodora subsp. variegata]
MAAVIIPQNLPVGYRFHPTDEEFVAHYLTNRVLGIIENPCIIPDVDICRWDPWELPPKFYGESIIRPDDRVQEWWFFCLQMPQQVKRTTPSGYWKKTGADRNVKARDVKIGTKKTLVFHIRQGSKGVKTNWVIHEYHLLTKDLNRNYVLCRIKLKGDEKADKSTNELENEAIDLAGLDLILHQPDEDSFTEDLIQAKMKSLMEASFLQQNRVQFTLPNQLQLPQSVLQSQNNSFPSNGRHFTNNENSFTDFSSSDNGLTDESIHLESWLGSSDEDEDADDMLNSVFFEEDEDVGDTLNADPFDANFFNRDQMQTQDEPPVIMENRRTRTIDSFHSVVRLDEKKGMVENKFNGSLVAPMKPMEPPVCAASINYHEEPSFGKFKQETAAKIVKPECSCLDETAARAKNGQISITENSETQTIESLLGDVPFEQKEGFIQSELNSSHVSSTKSIELLKELMTPKIPESPRIYINEEPRLEKVEDEGIASRNVKTECVSLDESAAKAKVLECREHGSASNSPRKTSSTEIEPAGEKSNSVTASTGPSTENTKSSANLPLRNLGNLLVGILLLIAITYLHFPGFN